MTSKLFGARVKRIEDASLLRGEGRFVDDFALQGAIEAAFVRSPHAHARILAIDTVVAASIPGVHAILTRTDLAPIVVAETLPYWMRNASLTKPFMPQILANDEVCHVGEAIAVVLADDRYIAEDAASRVAIDFEPLPAAVDCADAVATAAAPSHLGAADNVAARFTLSFGDVKGAFAEAAHVFRESIFQHKGLGQAIECRAVLARFDALDGELSLWSSTQMPHALIRTLVEMLDLEESQVRVAAPDVGGGFGPKFVIYPEEIVIAAAAILTGRPVKWTEDRREHFVATTQERDQYWDVEIAADADGRLLGLRGSLIHDVGAYLPYGINLPQNAAAMVPGPYRLPAYRMDVTVALTNKVAVTPVRGAGRSQAAFIHERVMDRIARELGLGRSEARRRNFVEPAEMPYSTGLTTRDGSAIIYDSGDFPQCQAMAMVRADHRGFAQRQRQALAEGRYIGIGFANYVEGTGRAPFESAIVRLGPSGKIQVITGASAQGQGIKTALAQICADQFDAAIEDVTVTAADTATVPLGLGAFASRQAVTAGSSVHLAAIEVRQKALKIAAHMLEAAEEDLEFADGRVRVKGIPDISLALGEIARAVVGIPGLGMPGGTAPGLEASSHFQPETLTYANGSHMAEVEVDAETGEVSILNYTIVHDCGRMINPMVVDGQIQGGAVHGIGNALYEWMRYDEAGQPLTVSFA